MLCSSAAHHIQAPTHWGLVLMNMCTTRRICCPLTVQGQLAVLDVGQVRQQQEKCRDSERSSAVY
jgi:hypothetical protein